MPLSPGTKLGQYEIVESVGAGGMGEVYRARDTKLGRDVAIKVLPDKFAQDKERLDRFEREARLLAQLNHSNIATLHGLEESDGRQFLVMELVEGETLAERIAKGPIPIDEAIPLFIQVAEGIEAAHEKGIIHRDLKPANIKIGPDGKPKILDFGLAKALAGEVVVQDLSQSPTLTRDATETGVLLGTAPYMSPEQARGKEVDRRTDIWSFGCVLFEALSGSVAFLGDTTSDTLAAVLGGEPDWSALPEEAPSLIRSLLRRCLEKELHERLRDAWDIRIQIEEALKEAHSKPLVVTPRKARARAVPWIVVVLSAFLIGGLTVRMLTGPGQPPSSSPIRFVINLPPESRFQTRGSPPIVVSPDGHNVVFAAMESGRSRLYLRELDEFMATPLAGTEDARSPFFSPDGEWVGFFARGELQKVALAGGPASTICGTAYLSYGASWGMDDTILFATSGFSGLLRVSANGGTPHEITKPDSERGERQHSWPHFLPDGKTVLFNAQTSEGPRLAVLSLEDLSWRALLPGSGQAQYVPTGHLLYAESGLLLAVPFNISSLETTGSPTPVLDSIYTPVAGVPYFSVSHNGSLVYIVGSVTAEENALVWVDRLGQAAALSDDREVYRNPRLSRDGRRVAVTLGSDVGYQDIWVYDLERGGRTRLTTGGGYIWPFWTGDDARIIFTSKEDLYWTAADGSGEVEPLLIREHPQFPGSSSPRGILAFYEIHPDTRRDIWVLPLEGERIPLPFLVTVFDERTPVFSPDGRWLAYTSNEEGRDEVYVRPYPGPGAKWKISTDGGEEPVWSAEGHELFYRHGNEMMVVAVDTEPVFSRRKPQHLFEADYDVDPRRGVNYDVSPDVQRFVMIQSEEEAVPRQFHVVLNWAEELERLVPTE